MEQDHFTGYPVQSGALIKNAVTGAVIALIIISAFLISAGEANPEWGAYWRLRPLLIVPFAGAMGGAFFYFSVYFFKRQGWNTAIAAIIGIVGFIIALWLGSVIGLVGTYWH